MDQGDPSDQLPFEADRWAALHHDLLSRCFECFESTARWPTLDQLQLDFLAEGQEMDVVEVAQSIPPLFGVVDQGCLELNVKGLSMVPAAMELLEIWVSLLRVAGEDGSDGTISGATVLAACEGDRTQAACLTLILMHERWPPPSGLGVVGDRWWIKMSDAVRSVRDARTVADVLKARGPLQSRPRPSFSEMFAPFERDW